MNREGSRRRCSLPAMIDKVILDAAQEHAHRLRWLGYPEYLVKAREIETAIADELQSGDSCVLDAEGRCAECGVRSEGVCVRAAL